MRAWLTLAMETRYCWHIFEESVIYVISRDAWTDYLIHRHWTPVVIILAKHLSKLINVDYRHQNQPAASWARFNHTHGLENHFPLLHQLQGRAQMFPDLRTIGQPELIRRSDTQLHSQSPHPLTYGHTYTSSW